MLRSTDRGHSLLLPFRIVLLEKINTQQEVVSSLTANGANDRQLTTIGIAYLPIQQVAFKLDLENWADQAGGSWQQWNTGLAYVF